MLIVFIISQMILAQEKNRINICMLDIQGSSYAKHIKHPVFDLHDYMNRIEEKNQL